MTSTRSSPRPTAAGSGWSSTGSRTTARTSTRGSSSPGAAGTAPNATGTCGAIRRPAADLRTDGCRTSAPSGRRGAMTRRAASTTSTRSCPSSPSSTGRTRRCEPRWPTRSGSGWIAASTAFGSTSSSSSPRIRRSARTSPTGGAPRPGLAADDPRAPARAAARRRRVRRPDARRRGVPRRPAAGGGVHQQRRGAPPRPQLRVRPAPVAGGCVPRIDRGVHGRVNARRHGRRGCSRTTITGACRAATPTGQRRTSAAGGSR